MAAALKAVVTSKVVGARPTARLFGVATRARDAWRELLATLLDAESTYLSPAMGFGLGPPEHAEAEVAEGLRYLTHAMRLALELYVERGPRFVRFVSPQLKLLGDNPDALYYVSTVQPTQHYIISGCRAGELYFSLSVHATAEGSAFPRVAADVNDSNIAFDADGCFSLHLRPGDRPPPDLPAGATWLRLPADGESVVTRHYFAVEPPAQLNRDVSAAVERRLAIVDTRGADLDELTDSEMARRLDEAQRFLRAHTVGNEAPDPTTAPPFFALEPNTIGPPQKWSRDAAGMGAVDIAYGAGRFLLRHNESLLIRGTLPRCRFASIVLWNRFLQTFDYARGVPVSLNHASLHLNDAKQYTIVLSARSPFADRAQEEERRANWIS